jgi:predicted permease
LSRRLRQQHLDIMRFVDGFVAEPLQQTYARDVRGGLIVLLTAVAFILLIACANIANLLLSRAGLRGREIALRGALGATRSRIMRQLLTESALLAAAGGVLGVLLAHSGFSVLKNLIPADLSRTISLTLNLSVLGVVILISFASAFLFGLAPALRMSKTDINDSLKEGGRGSVGMRGRTFNHLLVTGEIALCLMLLVASGLLLETFVNLRHTDPGLRSDHVLTVGIPVSRTSNPDFNRRSQFFQSVLERVRALPGVTSAAFTSVLPLTWQSAMAGFSGMAGFLPEGSANPDMSYGALDRVVSPGYFETMRIPLVRGRLFDDRDGTSAPLAAIVNGTMARAFWPNQDVIGKRFSFIATHGRTYWIQIVGVVGDVKELRLNEPAKPEMYFPYWQAEGNYMGPSTLVIRTTSDPMSLANAARHAVWSVDPDQPVSDIMTMDDVLDREVEPRWAQAMLLGGFAALALALACVGIYGVMAHFVTQSNHEIGVRMALGARPGSVLRLVLGRGAILAVAGVAAGMCGALAATQLMRGLLYGVGPTDPTTVAGAAVLLTVVALAACYVPARRAAKVDPMVALRYD